MSKLAKAITVVQTNKKIAASPEIPHLDYTTVKESYNSGNPLNEFTVKTYDVYRIGVEINSQVAIDPYLEKNAKIDLINEYKKNSKLAIIEEIFGEFRLDLIKARQAFDMYDYKKAKDLISLVYQKMFYEGIDD